MTVEKDVKCKNLWNRYLVAAIIGGLLVVTFIELFDLQKQKYILSHNWETIICLEGIRQISVGQYIKTKKFYLRLEYSNETASVNPRELSTTKKEEIQLLANKISRVLNGKPLFPKLLKKDEEKI